MYRLGIIGSGNVAFHLWQRLKDNSQVQSVNIWSPHIASKPHFKSANVTPVDYMQNDDIVIIASSDTTISEIANQIPEGPVVVHTSGFTSIDAIKNHKDRGVIYPLQTFSVQRNVKWGEIPVFIQSDQATISDQLKSFAALLSPNVQIIDEEQRKKLHIDGVFTNNFVNLLLKIVEDHCRMNGVEKSVFFPLLDETVAKYKTMDANAAQTGPAIRDDKTTIQGHLEQLKATDHEVYELLTKVIQQKF